MGEWQQELAAKWFNQSSIIQRAGTHWDLLPVVTVSGLRLFVVSQEVIPSFSASLAVLLQNVLRQPPGGWGQRTHVHTRIPAHTLKNNCTFVTKPCTDGVSHLQVSRIADSEDSVMLMLGRCLPHIVPNVLLAKREVTPPLSQTLLFISWCSLHPARCCHHHRLLLEVFNRYTHSGKAMQSENFPSI